MLVVKLAAVLKARSGDKRGKALRIERQMILQPQDGVGEQHLTRLNTSMAKV